MLRNFIITLILASPSYSQAFDQPDYSIASGIGAIHTGLGTSLIIHDTDNTAKAIGLGCSGWSSSFGHLCGFSASYISLSENKNHAVHGTASIQKYSEDGDFQLFPSIGYMYSARGWSKSGSHIGFDLYTTTIFLNWGYKWAL